MLGKSWLCEVLGVDEKELEKHKQKQKPAGEVVEKLLPKKQDKTNSGAGGASAGGGANANKNAVTINKPPSPIKTAGTAVADDPLAAYSEDLAKQKQEKALQTLWGMTGAGDIWGNKEPPKVATAAETLRPWGLDKTTGQAAADDEAADYQRLGSGALVYTADKADSDPLALLKSKWQQERQQTGGSVVTGDGELLDWVNNDGYLTLPTFGDTLQYYNGTNKEGGASAENNPVKNYLGKSSNQFWRGNYTDDVTALGTAAQLATGFFDLDLPADIRDLTYDITHWQTTPGHIGQTVLDAVGLIPVIGMVKYGDELGTLAKNADKAADVAKGAEDAAEGAGKTLKISDEQFGKKVGKHAEDFGLDVSNPKDRNFVWNRTNDIYYNPTEIRKGVFRGQGEVLPNGANATGKVKFYIQGNDVVMTDMNGKFITIMKDGINNIYVKKATKIWP